MSFASVADVDQAEREQRDGDGLHSGLLILLLATAVAGLATGFVGGAFRWVLDRATELRGDIVTWALETPSGWIVPILLTALAAATAATIVRLSPRSAGSGIQDVEAVVRGEVAPPRLDVIPARFVGGALAIGGGLVLGREGPTVHMGAALGAAAAQAARRDETDVRIAQSALSGAGLAVAFNAPIGGALFVFEELTHRLTTRLMLATLVAVGVAVACARIIIGNSADFDVARVEPAPLHALPLFVAFGVVIGLLGAAYSSVVVTCLTVAHRLRRIPPTVRAALVGAVVGAALLYDPLTVSGGDAVTQLLLHGQSVALPVVLTYLVIRFFAGPLSYAAGTPGGLFAPLLALGALSGLAFIQVIDGLWPGLGPDLALTFVFVGMSTLFAAVVRAPLTGIVLVIEMTAVTSAIIPMIAAGAAAVLTATALRSRPVYDRLREMTGKL